MCVWVNLRKKHWNVKENRYRNKKISNLDLAVMKIKAVEYKYKDINLEKLTLWNMNIRIFLSSVTVEYVSEITDSTRRL